MIIKCDEHLAAHQELDTKMMMVTFTEAKLQYKNLTITAIT